MDRDFVCMGFFRTWPGFPCDNVSIRIIMSGRCLRRCLGPCKFSSWASIVECISRIETPRSSDRRLTGDSGRESDTSEGGGVKGYSISEASSSE